MQMARRRGCVTGTLGAGGVAVGCGWRWGERREGGRGEERKFFYVPAHKQQHTSRERAVQSGHMTADSLTYMHTNLHTPFKKNPIICWVFLLTLNLKLKIFGPNVKDINCLDTQRTLVCPLITVNHHLINQKLKIKWNLICIYFNF